MNLAGLRVFLAAPYSQWMSVTEGRVADEWRVPLERLRRALIEAGARVFSAHHNEDWGAGWLPADQCTPADFLAMRATDLVVAVLGEPLSGGVAVELGWASAFTKPVVLVGARSGARSPLVAGLGTITPVTVVEYDDFRVDLDPAGVVSAAHDLVRGTGDPAATGIRFERMVGVDVQ
jgi:nucleoside 2-deoxyribosyltransferase